MHLEIKLVNVFLLLVPMYASAEEPVYGCSQLQSLEHLLEKLVRIEFKLEQLEKKHSDASESTGRESGSCAPLQRLDDLSHKIEELDKSIKGQRHSDVKVAFTATMTDTVTNLQSGQIVIFKKLVTNIGDAYKPSSGQFIAPVNGTYHFHTSFLSGNGAEVWTYIDLNGQVQVRADARGTDSRHGTGSQSVILELKTGDIVSVKIYQGNTILGLEYSSFSGFLLN